MNRHIPIIILLITLLSGCLSGATSDESADRLSFHSRSYKLLVDSKATSVELHFYHVENRLPPQMAIDAMIMNLENIIPEKEISVPEPIPIDVGDQSITREWSNDDFMELKNSHQKVEPRDKFILNIFILNGIYNQYLGIYYLESIFVFPDRYLGQEEVYRSIFVHEMGHAIGLVNSEIPMTKYRLPSEQSDPCQCHSTQEDSPMYYIYQRHEYILEKIEDNKHLPYKYNNDDLADIRSFIENSK